MEGDLGCGEMERPVIGFGARGGAKRGEVYSVCMCHDGKLYTETGP